MNWEGYEVEGQMDISEFLDDKGASMTENEAIKAIEHDLEWHSKELQPKYKEVLRYTIQALEEIQQYRAIGMVEEIKSFFNENRKAGYKHGYLDGYAKAIDEFAERLKDLIAKNVEDAESSNDLCCEIFQSEIDEIAEQMKAGVKNESN